MTNKKNVVVALPGIAKRDVPFAEKCALEMEELRGDVAQESDVEIMEDVEREEVKVSMDRQYRASRSPRGRQRR